MRFLIPFLLLSTSLVAQPQHQGRTSKQICTSGDAYTVVNGDQGSLLWSNDSNNCIVTLPQAGASSAFMGGWYTDIKNIGTGVMTVVPTTSTCDGQVSCFIGIGGGIGIVSDGTNYETDGKSAPIVMFRNYSNATATNCFSADGGSYNPLGSSGSATCASATSIQSFPVAAFTVPANFFATNHSIQIFLSSQYTTSASGPTWLYTLKATPSGGSNTVMWTGTATATGASVVGNQSIGFVCTGTAALSSSTGSLYCGLISVPDAGIAGGTFQAATVTSSSLNTQASFAFTFNVTYGSSVASNWTMVRNVLVIGYPY